MKKVALVTLLLCVCVIFLTACTSLSTYLDRLGPIFSKEDFGEDDVLEYAERFELNEKAYGFIEGVKITNNETFEKAVLIACTSEAKAENLVADLTPHLDELSADNGDTVIAVNEGRFVFVGNEGAINAALGK